jgi:glutaminase
MGHKMGYEMDHEMDCVEERRDRWTALTEIQIQRWLQPAQVQARFGRLPDYIPRLAELDPDGLAIAIQGPDIPDFALGDVDRVFVLMSIIKPLLLLFLLDRFGIEPIFSRVGVEPSDQPFHSVAQLASDRGRPRNPMINSGAILLTALLPGGNAPARCEALRRWLNERAGCNLQLDPLMLESVKSLGNESNRSIASLLHRSGYLDDFDLVLDTYNRICCLSGTVQDLVQLGTLLAIAQPPLEPDYQRIVNSLMLTCGLYEASSKYAIRIGLPIKSGVSGSLLAVLPNRGAIAIYSPPIDELGNSVGGLFLLEQLVQDLRLSLFQTD